MKPIDMNKKFQNPKSIDIYGYSYLYFSIDLFLFFVEKGKYYIDFKNGSGQVGEGDPASKADVTITMNEEIFLKIFNRKLTFIIVNKYLN